MSTLTAEQQQRRQEVAADLRTGKSMYELLGGDTGLRAIVNAFYDIMESDPKIGPVRKMHKPDLGPMRIGLFEFLSGWLGGPNLYIERNGSPCLTGVHMGYTLNESNIGLWLECMQRAMDQAGVPLKYSEVLMPSLADMAEGMRIPDPRHDACEH
jgi:hemoglobin